MTEMSVYYPGRTVRQVCYEKSRSLLETLTDEDPAGVDTSTVLTFELEGGGPGARLMLWFDGAIQPTADDLPVRAVYEYYDGGGRWDSLQYNDSEADALWARLTGGQA